MKPNYEKNYERQQLILNKNSTDLNGQDLNEVIGKIVIGYGNECINKPAAGNGYIINIPHSNTEIAHLYNRQFFIYRASTMIFQRYQENGVWSEWTRII